MSAAKQLKATAREGVGKGAARAVRRQGRVPAVIYGLGAPAQPISIDFNETKRLIYAGGFLSTLFEIDIDGKKTRVIPRDYQLDKVKDFPLHVDFLRVAKGAKIEVEVPLHVVGDEAAPGVKNGGTLSVVHHKVAVLVEPESIPDAIEIDASALEIGDSIHIDAIKLPDGVEFAPSVDRTEPAVTIVPPTVSEETEEASTEA